MQIVRANGVPFESHGSNTGYIVDIVDDLVYAVYKSKTVLIPHIKAKGMILRTNYGDYLELPKSKYWFNHLIDKRLKFIPIEAIESVSQLTTSPFIRSVKL